MAKRKIYTEDEKQAAVAIYIDVERGPKAAEKETGINRKTIAAWVSKADLAKDLNEKRQRAVDASKAANELRWERIIEKLGIESEACLDDMRTEYTKTVVDQRGQEHDITRVPEPGDRAKLATAFGILFDKRQLATGGPTSNVESNVKTPDLKGLVAEQKQKNETVKAGLMAKVLGNG